MERSASLDRRVPSKTSKGLRQTRQDHRGRILTGLFLNDQLIEEGQSLREDRLGRESRGAWRRIMGGGIAYQSASKGIPIVMKDINDEAIETGLGEAKKLLTKLVSRGKIDADKMGEILMRIRETLSYGEFDGIDFVVEAVVENPKIKQIVLAEVAAAAEGAIITSNTSSISITLLAQALENPEFLWHAFATRSKMPPWKLFGVENGSRRPLLCVIRVKPIVVRTAPDSD